MPAAENSASHAAWQATSASEWPSRPRSPGHSRPASHSSRSPPAAKACTSTPTPVRGIPGVTMAPSNHPAAGRKTG